MPPWRCLSESASFLNRRDSLLIFFVWLGLLSGCGGYRPPSPSLPAVNHTSRYPDNHLHQQLAIQATRLSPTDYRDYQVGPEDLLAIEIYGQDNLNRELRVNGQGEITMPLVGVVKVAGLTPQQIERRLQELYDANYLVNPQVTVAVKEFRHQRVSITGAVAKPGSYEIIGPRTLLEVLSLAGGFVNQGYPSGGGPQAGDVIHVIRPHRASESGQTGKVQSAASRSFDPQTETIVIDLHRLVSGKEPQLNIRIRNGDVIHVPFAGTAYVLGGVRKPGGIPVKENITVSQAVAMAGGVDPILGTNRITVMRFDDQGKPQSINLNLGNIMANTEPDLPLQNNDVVMVRESPVKKTLYIIRTLLPIPSGSYAIGY